VKGCVGRDINPWAAPPGTVPTAAPIVRRRLAWVAIVGPHEEGVRPEDRTDSMLAKRNRMAIAPT
jgi:hypothetical protein